MVRAGRKDRRPAAIPLAGADAGRLAPLLQQGRGQELHRPDGPAQDEHLPLALERRSRLAGRDQAIPQAHGGRRLAEGNPLRAQSEGRHGLGAGRAVRRVLYPGRHPRDRRLCQGPLHHDRARNRHARPLGQCAGGLSRVHLHGQARRPQRENGRLLRRQRRRLRVHRGDADRTARSVPEQVHPHRRRRGGQGQLEEMREMPGPHPQGRAQERERVAELFHPPAREVPQRPPSHVDRLGRDSRRRAGAQRDGDELAGHRGRHRRGQRRARRGDDAHLALLFRLLPGEVRRAQGHRRLPAAEPGLFLRADPRGDCRPTRPSTSSAAAAICGPSTCRITPTPST